jgi:hypothetical protein
MNDVETFKQFMFNSIQNINYMRHRRNECFQMMGMYDGAMSERCKNEIRKEYEFWDSMIQELESHPVQKTQDQITNE